MNNEIKNAINDRYDQLSKELWEFKGTQDKNKKDIQEMKPQLKLNTQCIFNHIDNIENINENIQALIKVDRSQIIISGILGIGLGIRILFSVLSK